MCKWKQQWQFIRWSKKHDRVHEYRCRKTRVSGSGRTKIWRLLSSQWNKPQVYQLRVKSGRCFNLMSGTGSKLQPLKDFPHGCQLVTKIKFRCSVTVPILQSHSPLCPQEQNDRTDDVKHLVEIYVCYSYSTFLMCICTSPSKVETGWSAWISFRESP